MVAKIGGIARNLRSAGELLARQEEAETPVFKTLPPVVFGMHIILHVAGLVCVCVCVMTSCTGRMLTCF